MDDTEARVRDLRQQLAQLDTMAKMSALTPAEAEKNEGERQAALDELRRLGVPQGPDEGAEG